MRHAALLPLLVVLACSHAAPAIPRNEYGLEIVDSLATYRALAAEDPDRALVDLAHAVPNLILDIRYATRNNFMKRQLYATPAAFLRLPAAEALRNVQSELRTRGLGLKVFDAYRPYSVTKMMWEPIKDPDYVADPAKGSRHNRGCAVDVTLIDLTSGRELPMPTGYDSFEPAAAHGYGDLPADAKSNRDLLRGIMERNGFAALQSEWWHYDFVGWQKYELLDISFAELQP